MSSSNISKIKALVGDVSVVGILGYGVEGRSSYAILKELYPNAGYIIMDGNENLAGPSEENTVLCLGKNYLSMMDDCDVVLRSPGIKLHKVYDTLVTSQIAIFTQIARKKIIGITGTKGKSTTTTLIHHLFSQTYKTALVGNIGVPALDSLKDYYDYYICEYSCHQLSDITSSPKCAVLLNLFPEHLDYYETVSDYYGAKRNIYLHQQEGDSFYTSVPEIKNGTLLKLDVDIKLENDHLKANSNSLLINKEAVTYSTSLHGEHNKLNQLYAVTIAYEYGVSVENIKKGLASFEGLAHRLETVYESNGLRYVNDSISTIPQSAIAAMKSYEDLKVVIIGGYDRGIDYTDLVDYINKMSDLEVVLFGQVGEKLSEQIIGRQNYNKKFAEAVTFACELGLKSGTILMSPAASSYDEFKSFVQRGDQFRDLVLEYYN